MDECPRKRLHRTRELHCAWKRVSNLTDAERVVCLQCWKSSAVQERLLAIKQHKCEPYTLRLQVVQPGRHNRLLPKIYVNLGITQEADGRLHAACDNYRCALGCHSL